VWLGLWNEKFILKGDHIMPTGYTAPIYDNKEGYNVKKFIQDCARGIGYMARFRDHDFEGLPERIECEQYYKKNLDETYEKLQKFTNMTLEEADVLYQKEYKNLCKSHEEWLLNCGNLKLRYQEYIHKIESWKLPSEELKSLKDLCLQQLNESMKFDCTTTYSKYPERITTQEWLSNQIKNCYENIEYYSKKYKEELEYVEKANNWIQLLRESIEGLE
jgi:hypothetical protein